MNYTKLEKNIIDVITEEQVKLGYRSEVVRLYYPRQSLNHLLETDYDTDQMKQGLAEFCAYVKDKLGKIEVSNQKERFCLEIPPQGVDYIYKHRAPTEFICDFIHTIERHNCTIEDLLQTFHKYSDKVHVEKVRHGEFDYLIYFENGEPDSFRYCITDEGCHMIYHRFSIEDYDDFRFQ